MPSSIRSLAVTLLLVTFPSLASAYPGTPRVIRILNPALAATFQALYSASPSARATIDELESTDLIVHVVPLTASRRHALTGTTHFVVRAGERRVLRIAVDDTLPDDRRAAALAHELHHALEVARAAWVVDRASFAALYRGIGRQSGCDSGARCYETTAAVYAGRRAFIQFRSRRGAGAPAVIASSTR